eukprot:5819486-Amphidinium_carterae.1
MHFRTSDWRQPGGLPTWKSDEVGSVGHVVSLRSHLTVTSDHPRMQQQPQFTAARVAHASVKRVLS